MSIRLYLRYVFRNNLRLPLKIGGDKLIALTQPLSIPTFCAIMAKAVVDSFAGPGSGAECMDGKTIRSPYSPLRFFEKRVAELVLSTLMTEEHTLLSWWQGIHCVIIIIVGMLAIIVDVRPHLTIFKSHACHGVA